jgi:hypothetical protein
LNESSGTEATKCIGAPLRCESPVSGIWLSSGLICRRHAVAFYEGDEAATFAAGQADALLEEGDLDGSAVWRRILAAIEELRRDRQEGEPVN